MGRPGGAHERLDGLVAAPGEGAGWWGWDAATEDFDGERGREDAGGVGVMVGGGDLAERGRPGRKGSEARSTTHPPSHVVDQHVADGLGELALMQKGHLFVMCCV